MTTRDYRAIIHSLNQRCHAQWQRAEVLQRKLDRRSWLFRLRQLFAWPARPVVEPPVEPGPLPGGRVSVIVPFRDQRELLRGCVRGVRASSYPDVELVLVDNGSRDERLLRDLDRMHRRGRAVVLRRDAAFNFSWLCNEGARAASGDWLLFLNNDTEVIHPDWIEPMLALAGRPEVGVVGATLVYPDGNIQHAGLHAGPGGRWLHTHHGEPADAAHLSRPRLVTAVTGACLLIGRGKFGELGGFDESLPVTYSDVDLCNRAGLRGWRTALTPFARLIHYEGLTRGFSDDAPGEQHLAVLDRFPAGAEAWPESNSTALGSPSASADRKAD